MCVPPPCCLSSPSHPQFLVYELFDNLQTPLLSSRESRELAFEVISVCLSNRSSPYAYQVWATVVEGYHRALARLPWALPSIDVSIPIAQLPRMVPCVHTLPPTCPGPLHWEPLPRVSEGYVGLYNPGSTCYMNSVLQQLFMIPSIRLGVSLPSWTGHVVVVWVGWGRVIGWGLGSMVSCLQRHPRCDLHGVARMVSHRSSMRPLLPASPPTGMRSMFSASAVPCSTSLRT